MLVTIFLVLINIFNGVKSNAPVSISLNAVDLYLVICIGLVFLALFEYAIVLFKLRSTVKSTPLPKIATQQSSSSIHNDNNEKIQAWPEEQYSHNNKLSACINWNGFFPIF